MRIGLFFGSFNPPHLGHVNAVYTILNSKFVDKVIVIPAFRNPWKKIDVDRLNSSPDAEFHFRYELCQIMFEDLMKENKVVVSDVEYHIWRQNHKYDDDVIYTYETLNMLNGTNCRENIANYFKFDDNIDIEYIITTTVETFATMDKWVNGNTIIAYNKFLLLSTPELMENVAPEDKKNLYGYPIITYKGITIHSTDIRNLLSKGKSPLPYISCKAYEYIKKNKKNFDINNGQY